MNAFSAIWNITFLLPSLLLLIISTVVHNTCGQITIFRNNNKFCYGIKTSVTYLQYITRLGIANNITSLCKIPSNNNRGGKITLQETQQWVLCNILTNLKERGADIFSVQDSASSTVDKEQNVLTNVVYSINEEVMSRLHLFQAK